MLKSISPNSLDNYYRHNSYASWPRFSLTIDSGEDLGIEDSPKKASMPMASWTFATGSAVLKTLTLLQRLQKQTGKAESGDPAFQRLFRELQSKTVLLMPLAQEPTHKPNHLRACL
jgi:hypothetical protein